ncbi:MAG: hypothetical protein GX098_00870 [Bacteroidales bacterium]|nr:hypothetical protein [Bacteroidales bacterium]
MRYPIFISTLILLLVAGPLHSQTAASLALNLPDWSGRIPEHEQSVAYQVFSRQYFCLSDWNATGVGVSWHAPGAVSGVLTCRDGISGFARYHLYLSHGRQIGMLSTTMQLRFTLISAKPRPLAFRLGANARILCHMTDNAAAGIELYDIPGWLLPDTPLTCGAPRLKVLVRFIPDPQLAVMLALDISSLSVGPFLGGVRVELPANLALELLVHLMPGGVGVGLTWSPDRYAIRALFDHQMNTGLTPTFLMEYR